MTPGCFAHVISFLPLHESVAPAKEAECNGNAASAEIESVLHVTRCLFDQLVYSASRDLCAGGDIFPQECRPPGPRLPDDGGGGRPPEPGPSGPGSERGGFKKGNCG